MSKATKTDTELKSAGTFPCCGQQITLPVRERMDRRCSRCGAIWRVDVTKLSETDATMTCKVEWTIVQHSTGGKTAQHHPSHLTCSVSP